MHDLDDAERKALHDALLRIGRMAAQGKTLPARMKLADSGSSALRFRFERQLGIEVREGRDGGVYGFVPESRRAPDSWSDLVRDLGIGESLAAKEELRRAANRRADSAFKRAAIFAPEFSDAILTLAENEAVARFVRRDDKSAADFVRLVRGAAERMSAIEPITLSQLGSDWFGDSKRLRSGTLRTQFANVLRAASNAESDVSEADLFARFGIEDNPYTTHAVVFVPFVYFTPDDAHGGEEMLDYPKRLFNRGEASVLSLETVRRINRVEILEPDCRSIVTSENAAPFRSLVSRSVPCVYTEGYPNFAVQRLLRLFATAGLRAEHAGDGDLDGYRIADDVAKCIPVDRIVADDVRSGGLPRRPLLPLQKTRLAGWLSSHADSPHAPALQEVLARGWLEQESFPLPPAP